VIFSFGGIWDAGDFKGCAIHVMNMGIRHLTVPRRNGIETFITSGVQFSSARVRTITSLLHHKFLKYYIASSSDIEY